MAMKTARRLALGTLASLLLSIGVAGCGGPKIVKVSGTLTRDGMPLEVTRDTLVTLVFAPQVEKPEQTYPARFDQAHGTYEVHLPAGKYQANVLVVNPKNRARPPLSNKPKPVFEFTKDQLQDIEVPR